MGQKTMMRLATILERHEKDVLNEWVDQQLAAVTRRRDLVNDQELREDSRRFLAIFRQAAQNESGADADWGEARAFLEDLSRTRARQGFSPSETATFVFSLKQPLFARLRQDLGRDPDALAGEMWSTSVALDRLGLYTTEVYQKSREEVIVHQQREMLELSTPVVQLWLDSARTQVVMENLLRSIVEMGATIAVIDITGVPTVDTLVAQHLLKTVAAARLMGADCIISGIRPQIAQTIVHLGVDLNAVTTKATLADAFAVALQRTGFAVTRAASARSASPAKH